MDYRQLPSGSFSPGERRRQEETVIWSRDKRRVGRLSDKEKDEYWNIKEKGNPCNGKRIEGVVLVLCAVCLRLRRPFSHIQQLIGFCSRIDHFEHLQRHTITVIRFLIEIAPSQASSPWLVLKILLGATSARLP